jgi:hypothetical protein
MPDVLEQTVASMGSLVFFLLLLGACLGWLALRRYRLASRGVLGVLAVCLIVFDLTSQGAHIEVEPNDPLVGYRHERAIEFLRSDPDVFRVETPAEVQGGWAPDWALIYEMDDLSGIWNPLRLGAYDVLTWVGIGRESRFYDLYNVKYLIAGENTGVPAHFEPAYEDGKRTIYRNPRALPRAFLVYRAEVRGDTGALKAARAADFDPAVQVVLKKGEDASPLDVDPGDGERSVEIVDRGPNHIDFHVVTPVPGYLVVSEMWMPDWVYYLDGARARPVLKANYTFRAVPVPAGTHRVHMVYRPRPWRIGLTVTLTTLAALLVWVAWSLSTRVRPQPARRVRSHDA